MLKFIIVSLVSLSAIATPVEGEIYYKLPGGDLAQRDVVLEVPSRGQGEVSLSGKNFEWKTTKFGSTKKNGQIIFWAVFKTQFRNFKSTQVFKGTYLKGKNKLIYIGNIYKADANTEQVIQKITSQDIMKLDSRFKYSGSFKFSYDR